jgi:hypothetical protein
MNEIFTRGGIHLKRLLNSFIIGLGLVLLSLPAVAFDGFLITFNNGTISSAGNSLNVSVQAWNYTTLPVGQVSSFNGSATLSVSPYPGTVTPGTLNFSGGVATIPSSGLVFYTSGNNIITIKDNASSAQTTFSSQPVTVFPGPAQNAIFLRQSSEIQEYLNPGMNPTISAITGGNVISGYGSVTLSAGLPVSVSVVAVDQYYNPITNTAWSYHIKVNGAYMLTTNPLNAVTGIGNFSWTPVPNSGINGPQDLFIVSMTPLTLNPVNDLNYIRIPNDCFMWTDAPAYVVAGAPFYLTTTATTTNLPNSALASWATYNFSLTPWLTDGSGKPGNGTLSPGNVSLNFGRGVSSCTYNVAEAIYILPTISDASATGKNFGKGGYQIIQVQPAAPASMSIVVTPANIQAQKTATLKVTVRDGQGLNGIGNLVHGAVVNFLKTAGSADSSVSPAQTITNGSGVATATFTGGIINEIATVRVSVGTVAPQSVDIRISVAPPSGGDMINYPNPFNPNTQKTSINYYLNADSKVEIKIYDAFGRTVLSHTFNAGEGTGDFFNATSSGGASFLWDGRNGEGTVVGNGIYIVKVAATNNQSGDVQKFTRRVGVLK